MEVEEFIILYLIYLLLNKTSFVLEVMHMSKDLILSYYLYQNYFCIMRLLNRFCILHLNEMVL